MSWLSRAASAARQSAVWLVPAERRDWAEAVWAEAHEVPPGWPRLAWRAGGVRLIAKEAQMVRRAGTLVLFTAAAAAAAWSAWPGSSGGYAATARAEIIILMLLLAGLPLLARWRLGPPGNRAARWLRAGCYAAILAIIPARAVTQSFQGTVPRGGQDLHTFDTFQGHGHAPGPAGLDPGAPHVVFTLIAACGLTVILALTARRTRVAAATLAIGAGAGLVMGAAWYAVDALGTDKYVTAPWLHGTMIDPIPAGRARYLEALAWIMLFGAPLAAGLLAGLRRPVPGTAAQVSAVRAWQGVAGLVSNAVGALFVTVLGTGTAALLLKSAWVRGRLYHGQHLTASAVYGRELFASQNVNGYVFLCVVFPIIGLLMGVLGSGIAAGLTRPQPDGGHPPGPGGPPGPAPLPDPPDGGRLADAGAGQHRPRGRYDARDGEDEGDQARPGLVGAGLGRLP